jgi:putative addiction module killer protein
VVTVKQTETFLRWERRLRDPKARAIIAARVYRLANGIIGDVSPVGEGISELRIHYGPGYRLYMKQRGLELVILLCGGDKGSQARDIDLAKKIARDLENEDG